MLETIADRKLHITSLNDAVRDIIHYARHDFCYAQCAHFTTSSLFDSFHRRHMHSRSSMGNCQPRSRGFGFVPCIFSKCIQQFQPIMRFRQSDNQVVDKAASIPDAYRKAVQHAQGQIHSFVVSNRSLRRVNPHYPSETTWLITPKMVYREI